MPLSNRIQSIIKFTITALAIAFIAWKISQFDDFGQAWELFKIQLSESPIYLLLLVLLGLPLHWLLEIIKWRLLILKCHPLSFKDASIAVISGLTMAIFTPNRIGEIVSRVFILPKNKRDQGVALSGVNTMSLLIVTQIFGLLGLALYLSQPSAKDNYILVQKEWIIGLAAVICTVLIVAYFNLNWLKKLVTLTRLDVKFPGINQAFSILSTTDKLKNLAWSAAKYLTYSLQFSFLLKFMGVNNNIFYLLSCIMAIYLILTYLPVITIGEAGVKGSITLLFLGQGAETEIAIILAAFIIWTLNLAIPAITGGLLLKKIRF